MAERRTETVTLEKDVSYELIPTGTGNGKYYIAFNSTAQDNLTPGIRRQMQTPLKKEENGKEVPIIIDADTTLVVKGSDKATLSIPPGIDRDTDGFKPRIAFHTGIKVENGPFTVAGESTKPPRIPLVKGDGVTAAVNDNGNLRLTTAGRRTYVIENGAPGLTFLREDKPITIATERDFGSHRQQLSPPQKAAPQQAMPNQPAPEGSMVISWDQRKSIETQIGQLQKVPAFKKLKGEEKSALEAALNVEKNTTDLGRDPRTGKNAYDARKLYEALETAKKEFTDIGGTDQVIRNRIDTIQRNIRDASEKQRDQNKTSGLPRPKGMSDAQLAAAVDAARPSTGTGDFVIGSTTKSSSIPNLGRSPNQIG